MIFHQVTLLVRAVLVVRQLVVVPNGEDGLAIQGRPRPLATSIGTWLMVALNARCLLTASRVVRGLGAHIRLLVIGVIRRANVHVVEFYYTVIILGQLVRHGETLVVRRRPPDVCDPCHVGKVDKVEPAVEDEPPRLPVEGHIVRVTGRGEGEAVKEKEGEDDHDTDEDGPPQLLVHRFLGMLFALPEVFQRQVERVKSPDVEAGKSSSQRQYNEEHEGPCNEVSRALVLKG